MPSNSGGACDSHRLRDRCAPVAALRHEPGISETLHQHHPGTCDASCIPPGAGRLGGEPVSRQRWDHQMERVRCTRAVRRRVGQRLNDLQLLDDGAGPSVRHDQRQRVLMLGTDVQEMNVQPVDLGYEVRERIQPRLARIPVVVARPVVGEVLHQRQPHTLRVVIDGLALGPPGGRDPATKIVDGFPWEIHAERPDCRVGPCRRPGLLRRNGHSSSLPLVQVYERNATRAAVASPLWGRSVGPVGPPDCRVAPAPARLAGSPRPSNDCHQTATTRPPPGREVHPDSVGRKRRAASLTRSSIATSALSTGGAPVQSLSAAKRRDTRAYPRLDRSLGEGLR